MTTLTRDILSQARRVVVKIGSAILTDPEGVDRNRLEALADQVAGIQQDGERQICLVSSGSVAAGAAHLGMNGRPDSLPEIQAAAAVGQGKLMQRYAKAFAKHDLAVGQMLLTRDGLDDRLRYLNARNTLNALFDLGAVPIINENDTVMVEELQFGDNDQLSGMVAGMAEADLLILLSDVTGLYERSPAEGESPMISEVPIVTPQIEALAGASHSGVSRGGMASKLDTAKRATAFGINVVLAGGGEPQVLERILAGEKIGTWFHAQESAVKARKQWLAIRQPSGSVTVDAGARQALEKRGTSLLPIGMVAVHGGIRCGDTISVIDEEGLEFARGLSNFSSEELTQICRRKSEDLHGLLGYACATTVVHRDNLVLTTA